MNPITPATRNLASIRRDYNQLPKEIREQGMDFHWSNQKVWDLDVPVEEMDVCALE